MTYNELFYYINKTWATVNDIQKIASCGKNKAYAIRNHIIDLVTQRGKNLPQSKTKIVPMSEVIDYLGIDVDYVLKMVKHGEI